MYKHNKHDLEFDKSINMKRKERANETYKYCRRVLVAKIGL